MCVCVDGLLFSYDEYISFGTLAFSVCFLFALEKKIKRGEVFPIILQKQKKTKRLEVRINMNIDVEVKCQKSRDSR